MTVYLSRSSRFRSQQRLNLRLFQAGLGERLSVRYNRETLPKDLDPATLVQQPAVFLLADSDDPRVCPVRLGQIATVQDEGERLELSVVLGGFAAAAVDRAAFSDWFGEKTQPGAQVWAEERGFEMPAVWETQQRLDAWRTVVRDLLATTCGSHYRQTTFLLPLELVEVGNHTPVDPLHLETGRTYRQRLHSLNSAGNSSVSGLGLGYDRTEIELLAFEEALPQDGPAEVTFRLLVPGSARVHCFVRPHGERSSQLQFDFHSDGQVLPRLLACEEASESLREGLRGLLATLNRHQALENPDLAQAMLESMLAMVPEDAELLRALAHHHHRQAQHARAVEVFNRLGAERLAPDDGLPFFLSACQTDPPKPTDDLADLLDRLPWERIDAKAARHIGQVLADLPEKAILDLLEPLAYLGGERFIGNIWSVVQKAIQSADGILGAVRFLQETRLDPPASLYALVLARSQQQDFEHADMDAWLAQTGLGIQPTPTGWLEALRRHLNTLVRTGQSEQAVALLQSARPRLSAGGFEGLRLDLADVLLRSGDSSQAPMAGALLSQATDAALVRGDLDDAVVLLERAALAHPENENLAALQARLEQSINAGDSIQMLAETLFAQRIKQLRDKLAGKRLLVVGGRQQKPWAEQVRHDLALSEIGWITSELGHPPRTDKLASALNQSLGAAAVLTFYLGHGPAEFVREEARRLGIPCAFVVNGTSKNALLRALIKTLLE